jgi:lipoate-protein ligase A
MRYLDLTLPSAAENLALDEALLEEAELADRPTETLRLWEPPRPMVVLGRSSKIADEVDLDACQQLDIPVLRRVSGGAAVLTGPGCLMYALVLSCRLRPALRSVGHAHRLVLGTMAAALRPLAPGVRCRGISDLALGRRKFSGNSLRLKRDHLLYHGTLLYDFPLELIGRCLKTPPRQPEYRHRRAHREFLANLALPRASLCRALVTAWDPQEPYGGWPQQQTTRLANERYSRPQWNVGR